MKRLKKQEENSALTLVRKRVRKEFVWLFFLSAFINLLFFTQPLYLFQVLDRVIGSGSLSTLLYLTILAGFAFFVFAALSEVRGRVLNRLSHWIGEALGPEVLSASTTTAALGHSVGMQGFQDLGNLRRFLQSNVISAMMDAPFTILIIGVLYIMHPWLGIVAASGAVAILILALLNERVAKHALMEGSGYERAAAERAEQQIHNADVARAMGMQPALAARWRILNRAAADKLSGAGDAGNVILNISRFLRMFLQIFILAVGAYLLLGGELTAGAMIAASILMGRALAPVEQAIGGWRFFISARSSLRTIRKLLSLNHNAPPLVQLSAPKGTLSVEELTYFHDGAKAPSLLSVSFSLEPGDVCAILGQSSSGKTTLCRLLVGVVAPGRGHVRLDGAEVYDWQSADLGRHVGYLPQEVELFDGTVAENIARMAQPDSEAVLAAAELTGLHDLILRLPDGYDYEIGEMGRRLSAGVRQRIGLARALYKDPQLVVLDEPNANLDAEGLRALTVVLQTLKERNRTTLIVSHTTGIMASCTKALVLEDGAVRHFGDPNSILRPVAVAETKRLTNPPQENPPTEPLQAQAQ
ncbi:MAG: type I secretion system permease/ATPase [Alphaproteobacteria bacterium]|nr:type I secretion system permease/ATPase [Alphaproteobacteria bacterium]